MLSGSSKSAPEVRLFFCEAVPMPRIISGALRDDPLELELNKPRGGRFLLAIHKVNWGATSDWL